MAQNKTIEQIEEDLRGQARESIVTELDKPGGLREKIRAARGKKFDS